MAIIARRPFDISAYKLPGPSSGTSVSSEGCCKSSLSGPPLSMSASQPGWISNSAV